MCMNVLQKRSTRTEQVSEQTLSGPLSLCAAPKQDSLAGCSGPLSPTQRVCRKHAPAFLAHLSNTAGHRRACGRGVRARFECNHHGETYLLCRIIWGAGATTACYVPPTPAVMCCRQQSSGRTVAAMVRIGTRLAVKVRLIKDSPNEGVSMCNLRDRGRICFALVHAMQMSACDCLRMCVYHVACKGCMCVWVSLQDRCLHLRGGDVGLGQLAVCSM